MYIENELANRIVSRWLFYFF